MVIFNTAINARHQWQQAMLLLAETGTRRLPSFPIARSALTACSRQSEWLLAVNLLEKLQDHGLEAHELLNLLNVAVYACERAQRWPVALALMEGGHLLPGHAPTYAAALQGFGERQWQQAIAFLVELEDQRCAEEVAYSAGLSVCSAHWEVSLSLLQKMKDQQLPFWHAMSTFVHATAKATEWEVALRIFRDSDLKDMDVVAFNAAIGACQFAQRWQEAFWLLSELQRNDLQADDVSYLGAIGACGKALQWEKASMLLKSAPKKLEVFNSVMSACARSSKWVQALQVFAETRRSSAPDIVSYNTLISACGRGSQRELAMRILNELKSSHMQPDLFTFSSAISLCQGHEALHMMQELNQLSVQANLVIYTAAIGACGRGRQWSEALHLFDEMKESHIPPTTFSFNTVMKACDEQWPIPLVLFRDISRPNSFSYLAVMSSSINAGQWQETFHLLREAERRNFQEEDMMPLRNTVISACGRSENWMEAFALANDLAERQVSLNLVTYNTLLDISSKSLPWQSSLQIFSQLRAKGLETDVITHNSLINAMAANKQWQLAFVLLNELQAQDLEVDAVGVSTALDAYMKTLE
ncbi:unnamed protein product [Durusdinium trenchii]|uniref:PROP1-like PPR domain-containing protein n=1 Tax=Durusdinium trenchii TaxID=1381693 RepID=A0ABP0LEZ6_9DINO